jgi:predicted metal-binding membrane protein
MMIAMMVPSAAPMVLLYTRVHRYHWRRGRMGAARMGMEHGLYCVCCCWSLMALLFVGGVMNLVWIAGLASV